MPELEDQTPSGGDFASDNGKLEAEPSKTPSILITIGKNWSIVSMLLDEPIYPSEMAKRLKRKSADVSKTLRTLLDEGLVKADWKNHKKYFSLSDLGMRWARSIKEREEKEMMRPSALPALRRSRFQTSLRGIDPQWWWSSNMPRPKPIQNKDVKKQLLNTFVNFCEHYDVLEHPEAGKLFENLVRVMEFRDENRAILQDLTRGLGYQIRGSGQDVVVDSWFEGVKQVALNEEVDVEVRLCFLRILGRYLLRPGKGVEVISLAREICFQSKTEPNSELFREATLIYLYCFDAKMERTFDDQFEYLFAILEGRDKDPANRGETKQEVRARRDKATVLFEEFCRRLRIEDGFP